MVTDDSSPDDACSVYYSVDGKKTWEQGRSVTVKGQGKRVIWTYAVDAVGNKEAPHAQEIYLDNTPPVTVALSSPTVARGKTTTIKYRVNDASPTATVSIRLSGPMRRTFSVGEDSCNQINSYRLTANLPAGTYTYTVNAKDAAGNVAVQKGSGRITVVPLSVAYKSRCKSISFKVLDRNANQLVGRKYVLRGQVFQIQDAGPDQYWTEFEEFDVQPRTQILLSVTSLGYGVYTDEVAAVFEGNMKRVYEDDIITIWGECLGSYSYESVAGWTITVPLIHIRYFAK
ncbi:MAG: Ig-like domain-containing protein [Actinobacteria bacterium]|nr:Ig-like domain-containing protein [Actinomycetota bacterium]